jgi:hypothetical protein
MCILCTSREIRSAALNVLLDFGLCRARIQRRDCRNYDGQLIVLR